MRCSIVVINYNYARFLREAIDSALAQTHGDVEVVVVDDGSTDHSREIIVGYGDLVVPVFKKNGGILSATNAGFSASSGDIVVFLDADDWLDPRLVETLVRAFRAGVSYVCWRLRMTSAENETIGAFPEIGDGPDEGSDAWKWVLDRGAVQYPPTSANAYARWALKSIFPLPEGESILWADVHLFHAAPFLGSVRYLRESLSNYRIHGNNAWYQGLPASRKTRRKKETEADFRKSLLRSHEKFELLEKGRALKNGKWGKEAMARRYHKHLRRIIFLRCFPEAYPFGLDSVRSLRAETRSFLRGSDYSKDRRFVERMKLLVILWMPTPIIRRRFFETRLPSA